MRALLVAVFVLLSACNTHKDFYATGGSRADGVIDVAYDFNSLETPVVDKRQAYAIAKSKCSLWGYQDAEPFGGQSQTCQARRGFGECSAWQVAIKYQCLGSLEQTPRPLNYLGNQPPTAAPVRAQSDAPASLQSGAFQPMSKEAFQNEQVQKLMQENVSYEEYQRRYRIIMGQ
jgi:hypothetical protein